MQGRGRVASHHRVGDPSLIRMHSHSRASQTVVRHCTVTDPHAITLTRAYAPKWHNGRPRGRAVGRRRGRPHASTEASSGAVSGAWLGPLRLGAVSGAWLGPLRLGGGEPRRPGPGGGGGGGPPVTGRDERAVVVVTNGPSSAPCWAPNAPCWAVTNWPSRAISVGAGCPNCAGGVAVSSPLLAAATSVRGGVRGGERPSASPRSPPPRSPARSSPKCS